MIDVAIRLQTIETKATHAIGHRRPPMGAERAALEQVATQIETHLRTRWPRRSGRSADAFAVFVDGWGLRITNDCEYAEHVCEKGSSDLCIDQLLIEVVDLYLPPLEAKLSQILTQQRPSWGGAAAQSHQARPFQVFSGGRR